MREWSVPRRYKLGQRAVWKGVVLVCTRDHYAGDGAEHPWGVAEGEPTLWAPNGPVEAEKLRVQHAR